MTNGDVVVFSCVCGNPFSWKDQKDDGTFYCMRCGRNWNNDSRWNVPGSIHFVPPGALSQKSTEKDPYGIEQHDAGAKLDHGKPDLSLLKDFGLALTEVGKVSTVGKIKYSRGGWQSVEDGHNRYTAAMIRHLFQERYEDRDEDTGMLHMAQTAWNALARLELYLRDEKSGG